MYLPGKVANPGGLESNAAAISAMQPSRQSVIPEFQMPEYGQEEQQGEEQQPLNIEQFLQRFEQSYNAPQNQPRFGNTDAKFIASTRDGG